MEQVWYTDVYQKKNGQACRLTIFRKVLSCGRNGHTAPLISQESSTKKETFGLWAPHPPCVYFSRFLCGEQLTRDFAFPTAHTPLDAWRKPFYNRPSDCCFRFAYSVALLIPITKRPSHPRASAWWPWQLYYMTVQIRHIDLSIGLRPLNGYRKL